MEFELGEVLQVDWDDRPIRVLMTDHIETFYDCLFPEVGWNMVRARTAVYYRIATAFLRSRSKHLRYEPLSEGERARHRPDLPMRLLQTVAADWNDALTSWPKIDTAVQLECQRLALIPYGPKGAPLKPIKINAPNGHGFTGEELLVAAHGVQAADCPDVEGVGLYRSGISSGVPSYYLWGAIDKAGHASPRDPNLLDARA